MTLAERHARISSDLLAAAKELMDAGEGFTAAQLIDMELSLYRHRHIEFYPHGRTLYEIAHDRPNWIKAELEAAA